MYQEILVPVVFDHDSVEQASIEVAKALLKTDGKITLLHVLEEIPGYVEQLLPREIQDATFKQSKAKLNDIASDLGVNVAAEVIIGHASRSILDYAEKHKSDCIIIASHKPGLEDYFIGSTAARIVRHAKCAVHVIR